MVDANKEIAKKIKDGSYYNDAIDWYARRYLYPITERTALIFFASVMCFALLISSLNIKSLITENEILPFPIYVDNTTDYFSIISPLAKNFDSTQEAVARYLVIDYLKSREEYSYESMQGDKLKYRLKKMKSSSSKQVLDEYKNYINPLNPYSPVVRYADHTNRQITIQSFDFIGQDTTTGKAKIIFEAVEQNEKDGSATKSLWEATVHFRLPDIETIARTGAPLRFLVKYYMAKPVQ
jgi:type IV secretory pathway component VirB8